MSRTKLDRSNIVKSDKGLRRRRGMGARLRAFWTVDELMSVRILARIGPENRVGRSTTRCLEGGGGVSHVNSLLIEIYQPFLTVRIP